MGELVHVRHGVRGSVCGGAGMRVSEWRLGVPWTHGGRLPAHGDGAGCELRQVRGAECAAHHRQLHCHRGRCHRRQHHHELDGACREGEKGVEISRVGGVTVQLSRLTEREGSG
eukprot:3913984-Rhodomonas_salina.2